MHCLWYSLLRWPSPTTKSRTLQYSLLTRLKALRSTFKPLYLLPFFVMRGWDFGIQICLYLGLYPSMIKALL
ncbi:MAG: hypothetical protein QXG49_02820, partial [Candidatus Bathyarchaeia archaeon]